ncbi:hypothetical protein AB0A76_26590 [Streptomyces exfoliatus]|uniref:Uncharacterized protein n=1 Tax=Streptomyces exfoliatus TaxID=1905 RepID=A0ABV3D2Q2_STREX
MGDGLLQLDDLPTQPGLGVGDAAIGNPRREAADARAREEAAGAQQEYQAKVQRAAQEQAAKKAAEHEARRPMCAGCGSKCTDARWETAQADDAP